MNPSIVPAEAIIESEPGDWWTIGRRARIGLEAASFVPLGLPPDQDASLRLSDLAPPYDRLNGGYDGLALYRAWKAGKLGLPDAPFANVPTTDPVDLWNSAELVYGAQFTTSEGTGATLEVPRHDGGDVDWYSVTAVTPMPAPTALPDPIAALPTRLQYPGAPHPRWWQIEDAQVDIGGFPPDRSHFATMLLIDLVVSHSDDWFVFPVDTEAGKVVTLHSVEVQDSFDELVNLSHPADWSMFQVRGLDPSSLLVWPTAATPLVGPALDEVVVGVDEDANLLWAVELRANGKERAEPPPTDPPPPVASTGDVRASERTLYAYRPSTVVPAYWHPYDIQPIDGRRRFVQAALADLTIRPPVTMPPPASQLLLDPLAPTDGPVHQIEPATVPTGGLRLDRRFVLGRQTNGWPILWMQRRRQPLLGPPVSNLRFDVLEQHYTVV